MCDRLDYTYQLAITKGKTMMKSRLEVLPPHAYLCPDMFVVGYPSDAHHGNGSSLEGKRSAYGQKQYEKGLQYGRDAVKVTIGVNSVWGATMKDGGHVGSYEKIGYHACTADLLQGFIDSGVPIYVYRWIDGLDKCTRIQ
jgi:hypothetical protein